MLNLSTFFNSTLSACSSIPAGFFGILAFSGGAGFAFTWMVLKPAFFASFFAPSTQLARSETSRSRETQTESNIPVETANASIQTSPDVENQSTDVEGLQSGSFSTLPPSEMILTSQPDGHTTFQIVFTDTKTIDEVQSVLAGQSVNELPEVPLNARSFVDTGVDAICLPAEVQYQDAAVGPDLLINTPLAISVPATPLTKLTEDEFFARLESRADAAALQQPEGLNLIALQDPVPLTRSTGINTDAAATRVETAVGPDLATQYQDASVETETPLTTPSDSPVSQNLELTDDESLYSAPSQPYNPSVLSDTDTDTAPGSPAYTPAPDFAPIDIELIADDFFESLGPITDTPPAYADSVSAVVEAVSSVL